MKIYTIDRTEILPITIKEAWSFFSNPHNLQEITPPELGLRITSGAESKIYPGMIITYTVTPFPFVKSGWVTEITQVDSLHYFLDEQRFGPYKFWHHKHFFTNVGGKTKARDLVHYALPFDPLSRLVYPLLVKRKLNAIFNYRSAKLKSIFVS